MYNTLASKVYDVLAVLRPAAGLTLVLDVSQQQSPVLYASESTNITKAVIEAYNVKSGVPAPPAPACNSARRRLQGHRPLTSLSPAAVAPKPTTAPLGPDRGFSKGPRLQGLFLSLSFALPSVWKKLWIFS